jgi:hypothetical protein
VKDSGNFKVSKKEKKKSKPVSSSTTIKKKRAVVDVAGVDEVSHIVTMFVSSI